jgi:hypothetical protein
MEMTVLTDETELMVRRETRASALEEILGIYSYEY